MFSAPRVGILRSFDTELSQALTTLAHTHEQRMNVDLKHLELIP